MAPRTVRIPSANKRTFRTNIRELKHAALKHRADVVVVMETIADDKYATTCDKIPGYRRWVRCHLQDKQVGGVVVCYRGGLQV